MSAEDLTPLFSNAFNSFRRLWAHAYPVTSMASIPIDPGLTHPDMSASQTQKDDESSSSSTESSTLQPRPRKRIHRRAPKSLADIMHNDAGTSLFLRPLYWTDKHTELLGASFLERSRCDTPMPPTTPLSSRPSRGHMQPSRTVRSLIDALTDLLNPSMQSLTPASAVKIVFDIFWKDTFSNYTHYPPLYLYYGGRVYRDAVRVPLLWDHPSHASGREESFVSISTQSAGSFGSMDTTAVTDTSPAHLPMMCYIGQPQLASMRRNFARVAPGPMNVQNEPVLRLQQLRSKQLVPGDLDQDPILVGIFLSMAQRHFYGRPTSPSLRRDFPWKPAGGREPEFHDVKLRILTHDDNADFIVYTAVVTKGFLQRFHDPYNAPLDESGKLPGMHIEYAKVPVWPVLGLRERLAKVLGEDMVGAVDLSHIERWDDTESVESKKRSRTSYLAETIIGSWAKIDPSELSDDEDEECEKSTCEMSVKKRCLSGAVAVNTVI